MPKRVVYCRDTLTWFRNRTAGWLDSVIVSFPGSTDVVPAIKTMAEYASWYREVAGLICANVAPNGYAIFHCTDQRYDGRLMDKAALLHSVAEATGLETIWHKIALRRDIGKTDLYRPTFGHLICFSKEGKSGLATPDVIAPEKLPWASGVSIGAMRTACEFVQRQGARYVVDPLCGFGTTLAVANALGLDAVGIDINVERCEAARRLKVNLT